MHGQIVSVSFCIIGQKGKNADKAIHKDEGTLKQ